MPHLTRRDVLVLLLGLGAAPAVFIGRRWKASAERHGQEPAEPFRIAGNFYYVGTNDVAAFLVTGPEGHVVLDGGYPTTAPMIMASIAKLGFDIKDVKVLLNSDPRDPAGWLAELQRASGAELWASEASADVIHRRRRGPRHGAAGQGPHPCRDRRLPGRASTTGSRTGTRSVSARLRSPRTSPAAPRAAAPPGRFPSATVTTC